MEIINDQDFLYLKEKLNAPNIFNFLGNLSYEIRHSNFLAWLFDAEASHGKGTLFLECFFSSIGEDKPSDTENFKIEREKGNIDILIFSESRVIVIENKLKAKDSDGQLKKYRENIVKEFKNHKLNFIYWTIEGLHPTDAQEAKFWRLYSYDKFVNALEPILSKVDCNKTALYLDDYIESLKIKFLRNSSYSQIGKNLVSKYKNNITQVFLDLNTYKLSERVTIQFLEKNSSFTRGGGFFSKEKRYLDAFKEACVLNEYELTSQGKTQSTYFEFVPKSLSSLINPDELCFGFSFRYHEKNGVLRLGFGVTPDEPSNKKIRDLLLENVDKYHALKCCVPVKARGKQHIGFLRKDIPFDTIQIAGDQINTRIAKIFIEEIKTVVNEIVAITIPLLKVAK